MIVNNVKFEIDNPLKVLPFVSLMQLSAMVAPILTLEALAFTLLLRLLPTVVTFSSSNCQFKSFTIRYSYSINYVTYTFTIFPLHLYKTRYKYKCRACYTASLCKLDRIWELLVFAQGLIGPGIFFVVIEFVNDPLKVDDTYLTHYLHYKSCHTLQKLLMSPSNISIDIVSGSYGVSSILFLF